MNFRIILLAVYLFGEFKRTFASETISNIQLAEDSKQKEKEVNRANERIQELVVYRQEEEEDAQAESNYRIDAFERHAGAKFSKVDKPFEGSTARRLWEEAKRASDRYMKIKATFKYEKFCYPPVSVYICETVFQNKFFKKEKITYDYSEPDIESDCSSVVYSKEQKGLNSNKLVIKLSMQYKMCRGFKENEDNIKSPISVYLQSAYAHPLIGSYKYFVIFPFVEDPATGGWRRSDSNIPAQHKSYRYEALLSLSKSELKPLS